MKPARSLTAALLSFVLAAMAHASGANAGAGAADTCRVLGSAVPKESVTAPKIVHAEKPVYPADSTLRGRVVLGMLVGCDGLVKEVRVLTSARGLDSSAVAAARRFTFEPARTPEGPVAIWVRQTIRFEPDAGFLMVPILKVVVVAEAGRGGPIRALPNHPLQVTDAGGKRHDARTDSTGVARFRTLPAGRTLVSSWIPSLARTAPRTWRTDTTSLRAGSETLDTLRLTSGVSATR